MDPEEAPETPAAGSEPSDDDILAAMADERQKKSDDKLLGDEEEKPAKGAKGKEKAESKKPAAKEAESDDEDEDEADDSDDDGEEADDDEEDVPQGSRAKALRRFNKGDVKGALKLALGLKDEDFDAEGEWEDPKYANAKFRVFRKKQERADAAAQERDKKQTERETNFRAYIEQKVKPAIAPAVKLLQLKQEYSKTRDPSIVVQIVEEFTEEGYDIVQKRVLKGEKGSAPDRRLLSQLQAMKAELEALKKPKEPTEEEKKAQAQTELKEYLGEIKEEIADHDVRKIPGATKKVYRMLRKHYDPKLKAPKISIEKAADRVLKIHLRTLARLRPETTAEDKGKKPAKVFAHSRAETREAAVTNDEPSDDDILRQMEIERAQKRREEAKKKAGKK